MKVAGIILVCIHRLLLEMMKIVSCELKAVYS